MVNLESAITERGVPEAKELEVASRALPLPHLARRARRARRGGSRRGHGGEQPRRRLRAGRAGRHPRGDPHAVRSPWSASAATARAAFTPYRVSVRGTDFAFFGADGSMREGASSVWAAGPTTPGLAAAHADRPRALLAAVRNASRRADVVVVYLHWGEELQGCPTHQQRSHGAGTGRSGGGHRRRQPCPRAARLRVAGGDLRRLRPGELPLVPRPPARDRRPPAHHPRRSGGRRLVGPGADPERRPTAPAARRGADPMRSPTGVACGAAPTSPPTSPATATRRRCRRTPGRCSGSDPRFVIGCSSATTRAARSR